MKTFFLVLLSVALFSGDTNDKPVPMPSDAQKAMTAYRKGVLEARQSYEKAETKVRAETVKSLEKTKLELTKKGDLEGAMLVSGKIKELNSGMEMANIEDEVKMPLDSPASKVGKNEIFIGTWTIADLTTLRVLEDGTAYWGSTPGKWTKSKKTIVFSWGNEIDIPSSRKCKVVDRGRGNAEYQIEIN